MMTILYICAGGVFLFLSAVCSTLEAALIATSRLTFKKDVFRDQPGESGVYNLWREHSDQILILIIISNNIAQMAFALTCILIGRAFFPGTSLALVAGCALMFCSASVVTFGKILPKSFGRRYSEKIAHRVIRPLYLGVRLFRPVVAPFIFALELFHRNKSKHYIMDEPFVTEERILEMMEIGQRSGAFEEEQSEMVSNIFEFGSRIVREVMRPRTQMLCISADTPLSLVPAFIKETFKSRIPVYAEQKDRIIGILYIKDIFRIFDDIDNLRVRDIMHNCLYVTEGMFIEDVLREFQDRKTQMAIVIDKFGGTAGLVTLEDILEELVGEIWDVHDRENEEDALIRKLDEMTYIVDGRTPIYDLDEIEIFLHKEVDYDTISGFLQHLLGRIPVQGEDIVLDRVAITVLEADKKTIRKVKVVKLGH